MKILVTGGAGFIGSHIVDAYVKSGYKVVVIDDLSTGKKENLNKEAVFYQGDITNQKFLREIFLKEKSFDAVNHHAAQKSVTKSVEDPVFDAKQNIIGSLNLFELSKKHKVKQIIFASTGGAIYGETDILPTPETAEAKPESPYGIAKLTVERYLKYYQQFGIKTKILRYSNVYGPRQDPYGEAGVIAIFIKNVLTGKGLIVYGDGQQTRDFIYVNDVVNANLKAIMYDDSGLWNVGTSIETKIGSITELISSKENITNDSARLGEIKRSAILITKIKKDFSWCPQVNIKQGVKLTENFFKQEKE